MLLTLGQFRLQSIENKKNRNNRLDKLISDLQKRVKENPDGFLNLPSLKSYKDFMEANPSVMGVNEIAPTILANLIGV